MRRCVVVLGAGRSGTSLLMNILSHSGMSISENLVSPSEQNHTGFFEDADILALQLELYSELGTTPVLPLPDGWLDHPSIPRYINSLGEIIRSHIEESPNLWGFKDPRTSTFLPLWIRVFNRLEIVPSYVLSVRHPGASVRSLEQQYGTRPEIGQLQWLQRNCDALSHTGGNCFIVHYERWFQPDNDQLDELLDFVGLPSVDSNELLSALVQPRLNRAGFQPLEITNKEVLSLYSVLEAVSGAQFNRSELIEEVTAAKAAMNAYKGWYLEGQRIIRSKTPPRHQQDSALKRAEERLRLLEDHFENVQGNIESTLMNSLKRLGDRLDGQTKVLNEGIAYATRAAERALSEVNGVLKERDERIAALLNELESHTANYEKRENALQEENRELKQQFDRFRRESTVALRREIESLERLFSSHLISIREHYRELYRPRALIVAATQFNSLDRIYREIIHSARWRLGCLVIRPLELMLMRWKKVLVTQHIESLFDRLWFLQKSDGEEQEIYNQLMTISRKLESDFDVLLDSKRWKVGSVTISLIEALTLRENSVDLRGKLDRIFRRLEKLELPDEMPPDQFLSLNPDEMAMMASAKTDASGGKKGLVSPSNNEIERHPEALETLNTRNREHQDQTQNGLSETRTVTSKVLIHSYPKISVIVPVFNKEHYLQDCLNSVFNNGYEHLEVLCVDDSSTDRSRQMISDIANNERRLRPLFLDTNSGASVARNRALKDATGRYVFFVDADDVIVKGAFESMVDRAEQYGSDIVRAKITGVTDKGDRYHLAKEHLLHDRNAKRVSWKEEESLWFYWYFGANLYRTRFLHSQCIRFPQSIRNEDPFFLCRCFLATRQITLYDRIVYEYRIGSEQKRKTPSFEFLKGWAMGNYYISRLFQHSGTQYQYYLSHLPSVDVHCKNIVRNLCDRDALKLLTYVSRMYSRLDMRLFVNPKMQPWKRKAVATSEYREFLQMMTSMPVIEFHNELKQLS